MEACSLTLPPKPGGERLEQAAEALVAIEGDAQAVGGVESDGPADKATEAEDHVDGIAVREGVGGECGEDERDQPLASGDDHRVVVGGGIDGDGRAAAVSAGVGAVSIG